MVELPQVDLDKVGRDEGLHVRQRAERVDRVRVVVPVRLLELGEHDGLVRGKLGDPIRLRVRRPVRRPRRCFPQLDRLVWVSAS